MCNQCKCSGTFVNNESGYAPLTPFRALDEWHIIKMDSMVQI